MATLYSSYTDNELLEFLRIGNHKAFEEIYRRYWDRLFYMGNKLLGDLMATEELVQDIFLDIWRRRDCLEITGKLEHYMVVALRYRVINLQARQDKAVAYRDYAARHMPQTDLSTEEQLRLAELKGWLETLVSRMPKKCQLVYRLREDGLSHREIATRMRITEKTVENHINRALNYLRAGIGQFFFFFFL